LNPRLTFYFGLTLLALCGVVIAVIRHVETGIPFLPGV